MKTNHFELGKAKVLLIASFVLCLFFPLVLILAQKLKKLLWKGIIKFIIC